MIRNVVAFLVVPLIVPLILIPYINSMVPTPFWFVVALITSAVTAYVGVFLFGVPAYLILRARNWTALWIAPLLGFVIGAIVWVMFRAFFVLSLDQGVEGVRFVLTNPGTLKGVIWPGGVLGSIVGTALWLIARPDRRTP